MSEKAGRLAGVRTAILVASDKGSRGERADASGQWLAQRLSDIGAEVVERRILPDDKVALAGALIEFCDALQLDLVFTCGGTGFTARDVTPEATLSVIERHVPGIPEAIRAASLLVTPMAMLTRGIAGIRERTLIVNLPGSPKAVRESFGVVEPVLAHAVETLRSQTGVECSSRPAS